MPCHYYELLEFFISLKNWFSYKWFLSLQVVYFAANSSAATCSLQVVFFAANGSAVSGLFRCKRFSCKLSISLQIVQLQVVYFAANCRCKWSFSLQVVAESGRYKWFCCKCSICAASVLFCCKLPDTCDLLLVVELQLANRSL